MGRLAGQRIVRRYLDSRNPGAEGERRRIHLVSYPRSGSTLLRRYLSILQGRPQRSRYPRDVVDAGLPALTRDLDRVEIVKTHQFPDDERDLIYLVRDGRNASLSFVYMTFLTGGHRLFRLEEAYEALRTLDRREGSWGGHVGSILQEAGRRRILFLRYEDLVDAPAAAIARLARFLDCDIDSGTIADCLELERLSTRYAENPLSGYLYDPPAGSIYEILKRHRRDDYWRHIFDARCKRYFHENGGTTGLIHFGYEGSPDWWRD